MKKLKEQKGMGMVEVLLLIVIEIGLVVIFKEQLQDLFNEIAALCGA